MLHFSPECLNGSWRYLYVKKWETKLVIAEVSLELEVQFEPYRAQPLLPLMPTGTLLWTRNICKSGTKSSKTNHKLCCNIILLWFQDMRLLEWPPGMESREEGIRAGYVRKRGLPLSGSHSESHPKCRTPPGFCHHIVAGRVAAYKNFCSGKFSSFF